MVQKDKFVSEKSFQKFILSLLIIFAFPIPINAESKIRIRKDCSLIKEKQFMITTRDKKLMISEKKYKLL